MTELLDAGTLLPLIAALGLAGALIGVLAGLFGIGGGAISVPVFYEVFQTLGHAPELAMPMAVGTSLAVIIPTSIQSSRRHYLRGTVDMDLLRLWAVPVLIGVICGALIARVATPDVFQMAFVVVAAINSAKLLSGGAGWRLRDTLPGKVALSAYGAGVGLVSALMGIGGGAVSNLILTLHNVPIHRAVSTSAGVGILIAVPGTIGYMAAGFGRPDLPADAIGFVSLATFALTVPTSLWTTRFGVKLAHRLSPRHLELAFGLFLLAACLRFLWAIVTPAGS